MEKEIKSKDIDYKKRLLELAKERKAIIQDIMKLKDEIIKECDRVLSKKVLE